MEVLQVEGNPRRELSTSNNRMGDEAFNENSLTEKLSKLNSSQQSIESLSKWCISNRKKAKLVVETWEKLFKAAAREQRVSLLYLANDILQNSRRKGSEFVNEFWKVLPVTLKGVYDGGDENCRKVAFRLVDIWEERKVFGSRGQNLKNEILGKDPPPTQNFSPVNMGKKSNPIKIVKRDTNSLRIKVAVGCLPEKILTAFHSVHDEIVNEEGALNKCRNAISYVCELEKDVVKASSEGNPLGSDVVDNLQKQENTLQECVSQLEKAEAIRVALASQLSEAHKDQESKLQLIRSELIVARNQLEQTANMRLGMTSNLSAPPIVNPQPLEPAFPSAVPTSSLTTTPPPPAHPSTSFMNSISEEDSKKAAAAAVAAKLTASSSSAQMLTAVLSSLVAEEAASMSSGLKRPRLENPMSFSEGGTSAHFSAAHQIQTPFLPPPPPPPPLAPLANSSTNLPVPYGYATNLVPAALSSNVAMGYFRPGFPSPQQAQPQQLQNQQQSPQQLQNHQQLPQQLQNQQQPPQQLQNQQQPPQQLLNQQLLQPGNGGYYRPAGIGFYGQTHQPSTPPIHRQ